MYMAINENMAPGFGDDEVVIDQAPAKRNVLAEAMERVKDAPAERPWSVDEVAEYAENRNIRKFTDEDASRTRKLVDAAIAYATDYDGTFDYMLSMRSQIKAGRGLSIGMLRGVLNTMLAEYRRRPAPTVQPDAPAEDFKFIRIAAMPKPGTYTLVRDSGHVTLRISPHWIASKRDSGVLIAEALLGSDNETDFGSFAELSEEGGANVWSSANRYGYRVKLNPLWAEALAYLLSGEVDTEEAGFQYALRSGRCFVCGRTLTVPASIHRGMGPVCAGRR